jgi:general stress protein YciG
MYRDTSGPERPERSHAPQDVHEPASTVTQSSPRLDVLRTHYRESHSSTQEGSSLPRDRTDLPQSKKPRKEKETAKPRKLYNYTPESRKRLSEAGQKGGQTTKEKGTGLFGLSKEEKLKASKKGGQTSKEKSAGFFGLSKEARSEANKRGGQKGGQTTKEKGTGFFGLSKEEKLKASKKGGQTNKEKGTGLFEKMEDGRLKREVAREQKYALTPDKASEAIYKAIGLEKPAWMLKKPDEPPPSHQ